jgi:hypothetical protein
MITYTWNINRIYTKPLLNGLTNVIHTIDWSYIGTDENNNRAHMQMPTLLPESSEENFIPYDNITEEMVISWLESILNVEDLQQEIINKIENIKNPPIIELPFPWVSI